MLLCCVCAKPSCFSCPKCKAVVYCSDACQAEDTLVHLRRCHARESVLDCILGLNWQHYVSAVMKYFDHAHPCCDLVLMPPQHALQVFVMIQPQGSALGPRRIARPSDVPCANLHTHERYVPWADGLHDAEQLGPADALRQRIENDRIAVQPFSAAGLAEELYKLIQGLRHSPRKHSLSLRALAFLRMVWNGPLQPDVTNVEWPGTDFLQLVPKRADAWHLLEAEVGDFCVSEAVYATAEECPFRDPADPSYFGFRFGNCDWVIQHRVTKRRIFVPGLAPHLMARHGLFKDIDPAALREVLHPQL